MRRVSSTRRAARPPAPATSASFAPSCRAPWGPAFRCFPSAPRTMRFPPSIPEPPRPRSRRSPSARALPLRSSEVAGPPRTPRRLPSRPRRLTVSKYIWVSGALALALLPGLDARAADDADLAAIRAQITTLKADYDARIDALEER